jgi:hypothetical protein
MLAAFETQMLFQIAKLPLVLLLKNLGNNSTAPKCVAWVP